MGFREELEEILDATPSRTAAPSCSRRPCRGRSWRWPGATRRTRCRIETTGEREAHADIAYQAVAVSPTDIEHVVVNLLRLHEAETANPVCATRDAGAAAARQPDRARLPGVALSGEHSQSERNNALQSLRDKRARVCVATDVAARGIDLPSVSLVIHVELPRDAEALQHRSGRTGRAGRKGIAVLIVPFRRRRNVETMLRKPASTPNGSTRPGPEQIRAKDRERLLDMLSARSKPTRKIASSRAIDGAASRRNDRRGAGPIAAHRPCRRPRTFSSAGGGTRRGEPGPRGRVRRLDLVPDERGRAPQCRPRWLLP
jgi:ATP-dependent RNA helicase DeaD